jgi:hypothetical protein
MGKSNNSRKGIKHAASSNSEKYRNYDKLPNQLKKDNRKKFNTNNISKALKL